MSKGQRGGVEERLKAYLERKVSDEEDVVNLLGEMREIKKMMEWLGEGAEELEKGGELISVQGRGRSFVYVEEVMLEVKERQMELF